MKISWLSIGDIEGLWRHLGYLEVWVTICGD